MQRMNMVEKIGSGLTRMRNAVKEYGLTDIALEADENWFKIIFIRPENPIYRGKENDKEGGMKGGMKKPEITNISDRQKEILDIIYENPQITIDEISEKMKIYRSAVQKHIEKLKKKDVIRYSGSPKSGYWEIKN